VVEDANLPKPEPSSHVKKSEGNPEKQDQKSRPTAVPTLTADQLDLLRIKSIIAIDFDLLKEVNPDIIGWIYSENTSINYPIVQGSDNSYYLTHLPDKTTNKLGSIFVDFRNKANFSDDTTVIFGHNMLDNSMFASLEQYSHQDYYEEHKSIYIFQPDKIYRIDLFAGYVTKTSDINSLHQEFYSQEERDEFIKTSLERSTFESGITIHDSDKFVSLYTCTYDYLTTRYVLHGKLVQLTP
jgi:sortase B